MSDGPEPFDPGFFWVAAAEGRLVLRRCRGCGRHHHYPRAACPHCHGLSTEWVDATGRGVVYSYTVVARGPGAGTTPAFVTLDEGVTIATGIVDAPPEGPSVGMPVAVSFRTEGERSLPMFAPSE